MIRSKVVQELKGEWVDFYQSFLKLFFLQKPLKTRVNSKYQSKGSTYILHLLAFVEIRLFNVFFCQRKARFGKPCGMRDYREKGAGMRDQDPPFQTLFQCVVTTSFCYRALPPDKGEIPLLLEFVHKIRIPALVDLSWLFYLFLVI